jgi:hypothetical protein
LENRYCISQKKERRKEGRKERRKKGRKKGKKVERKKERKKGKCLHYPSFLQGCHFLNCGEGHGTRTLLIREQYEFEIMEVACICGKGYWRKGAIQRSAGTLHRGSFGGVNKY